MKNSKPYIIAGIALLAVFLIYQVWQRMKGSTIFSGYTEPVVKAGDNKATITKPAVSSDAFPLKQGSKGDNVKLLQRTLGGLIQDGIFGQRTEEALFNKLGKMSITQAELDALVNAKNAPASNATAQAKTATSIDSLTVAVKTESEAPVIMHNAGNEVWQTVLNLSTNDLVSLADNYKKVYGKALYKTIADLNFVVFQTDDNAILNKLEAVGRKV